MTPSPAIESRIRAMLSGEGCTSDWIRDQIGCHSIAQAKAYALSLGAQQSGKFHRWQFPNLDRKRRGEVLLNQPWQYGAQGNVVGV